MALKAVVFHEFGTTDVLRVEELPDPVPGPGEVLVDITATALNHLDVDMRQGISRFPIAFPHTVGVEPVGPDLGARRGGRRLGDRRSCRRVPHRDMRELRLLPHRARVDLHGAGRGSSASARAARTRR